jgi:ABC-2 type transport system ATP-binding protein
MVDPSAGGLSVADLDVRFGAVHALDGMSFAVQPGQLVGFLGPNGAGKTTTMRAILGLVTTQRGTVTWRGAPIDERMQRRVGYMPEERGLYARMKVFEQVVYFGRLSGLSKAEARASTTRWLERFGLADRHDSHLQDLSHGNQQRVQLAVALVHEPELLVLDEPFSGLDPVAVKTMSDIISERAAQGASVLFSSHQLDLVEGLCEDVVIVRNGRSVADGRVSDLRALSARRVLRVELAGAATPGAAPWLPTLPDAEIIELSDHHLVARVGREVEPAALLAALGTDRRIRTFALEPPPLSEVFLDAVSARSSVAEGGDVGAVGAVDAVGEVGATVGVEAAHRSDA